MGEKFKMWDQEDMFIWFWINFITTLFIAVLAIEQYTVLVASPFGVLGYVIVGWFILRLFEHLSTDEEDMIIDEFADGMAFAFGLIIQTILICGLVWNQWVLTGDFIWQYAPILPITYWLAQITYRIAKSYRCGVGE